MSFPRRSMVLGTGLLAAASATGLAAPARSGRAPLTPEVLTPVAEEPAASDPRSGERGIGRPDAQVQVIEYFSLTCSHCAAFHRDTFPRVKRDMVEAGSLRLVWRDFPLDGLALAAAAVARALPPERYEGFIGVLLNSQDRWAFTRGEPKEELAKIAALAGMARPAFDRAFDDEAMKRTILESRLRAEHDYRVQSTPTFVFARPGGPTRVEPGNMSFDAFRRLTEEARRA